MRPKSWISFVLGGFVTGSWNLESHRLQESWNSSASVHRRESGLPELDRVQDCHFGFWSHHHSYWLFSRNLGNLSVTSIPANFCSHLWPAPFLGLYFNFRGYLRQLSRFLCMGPREKP